jgi:hypothetical protein
LPLESIKQQGRNLNLDVKTNTTTDYSEINVL